MNNQSHMLQPDWHAPPGVQARVTLRHGGVSRPPYDTLNLGDHVGDAPQHVATNRRLLADWIGLPPHRLQWLKQVHGHQVIDARPQEGVLEADAVMTDQPGVACIVMTADCLPVFFCDRRGTRVAVAHAGWRGLVGGVLEATVAEFADPAQVMGWLGPAIGPASFEVGGEVRAAFLARDPGCGDCFKPNLQRPGHWFADLYGLARRILHSQGVADVSGGGFCTMKESDRFFSYRRDGQTGRMANIIWLQG